MAARTFRKSFYDSLLHFALNQTILLDGAGESIIYRESGLGDSSLAGQFQGECVIRILFGRLIHQSHQIVGQHMLQQQMKTIAVIMMTEMTKFMQQDIIPKH